MNKYKVSLIVVSGRFTYPFVKDITAYTQEKAEQIAHFLVWSKGFPDLPANAVTVTDTLKLKQFKP